MAISYTQRLIPIVVVLLALWTNQVFANIERIYILDEIDDNHIIIVTESGEQLLLEKWTLRFSPLLFEGKYFTAEVSPLWVTIYFESRDPIKWSVEKSLGYVTPRPSTLPGIAENAPAYPGTPLQQGSRGDYVRIVQQQLKDRGWIITVDGIFGPQMRQVIVAFQRQKKLVPDGIVGPKTWAALWLP